MFPTKLSALNVMEHLSQPINVQKYQNKKYFNAYGNTGSRSQSPMEAKLHKRSDTVFD